MKEPYEKPEIISEEYDSQVFLAQCGDLKNSDASGSPTDGVCYMAPYSCTACSIPEDVLKSV